MDSYDIKHQHQKNYKPFRTQLCKLLLTTHKTQTFNIYTMKLRSFQWTPISKLYATQLKQLTQTQPFTYPLQVLNAVNVLPRA